jgi:hypothetical protein
MIIHVGQHLVRFFQEEVILVIFIYMKRTYCLLVHGLYTFFIVIYGRSRKRWISLYFDYANISQEQFLFALTVLLCHFRWQPHLTLRNWSSFPAGWGGALSNQGLLHFSQVHHHWATFPLRVITQYSSINTWMTRALGKYIFIQYTVHQAYIYTCLKQKSRFRFILFTIWIQFFLSWFSAYQLKTEMLKVTNNIYLSWTWIPTGTNVEILLHTSIKRFVKTYPMRHSG